MIKKCYLDVIEDLLQLLDLLVGPVALNGAGARDRRQRVLLVEEPEGRRPFRASTESTIGGALFLAAELGDNVVDLVLVGRGFDSSQWSLVLVNLDDGEIFLVDAEGLAGDHDPSLGSVFGVCGPLGLLGPELPIGRTKDAVGDRPEFANGLIMK